MAAVTTKLTVFPNGTGDWVGFAKGGTAGDFTVVGAPLRDGDRIKSVVSANLADGTVADLTDEFTVSADATVNNDGGTNTTNLLLIVQFAMGKSLDM